MGEGREGTPSYWLGKKDGKKEFVGVKRKRGGERRYSEGNILNMPGSAKAK